MCCRSCDTGNHAVRAIDLNDSPPTLKLIAGEPSMKTFDRLHGVDVDPISGDLYIGDTQNHLIQKIAVGSMGIPAASPRQ